MDVIEKMLREQIDEGYAAFQRKLMPTVLPETVLGVRTPVLRDMAKRIRKEPFCEAFLEERPHTYFEENQLHAFLLSECRDFETCIRQIEEFLPLIDNWATCDQTLPKVFAKHKEELLPYIEKWLESDHTYTIRFAVGMLMRHYLDEDFKPGYAERVAKIRSEEYYIRMECAWYMATALAKQWDSVIGLIEQHAMDEWTHNKTIQKAIESYRITAEQKTYLRTLKRNNIPRNRG